MWLASCVTGRRQLYPPRYCHILISNVGMWCSTRVCFGTDFNRIAFSWSANCRLASQLHADDTRIYCQPGVMTLGHSPIVSLDMLLTLRLRCALTGCSVDAVLTCSVHHLTSGAQEVDRINDAGWWWLWRHAIIFGTPSWRFLSSPVFQLLVTPAVLVRLDYCNCIFCIDYAPFRFLGYGRVRIPLPGWSLICAVRSKSSTRWFVNIGCGLSSTSGPRRLFSYVDRYVDFTTCIPRQLRPSVDSFGAIRSGLDGGASTSVPRCRLSTFGDRAFPVAGADFR